MKNMKKIFLFLLVIASSCGLNKLNSKKGRIYIIQQFKLNATDTLFWFEDAHEITHNGMNYFQISDNKCKLSVSRANAK
jgi:hypothetical protein